MKTRILLLTYLLLTSITGFSVTKTVTASSLSFAFSPMNLVISSGDIVDFQLASIHSALEVSQSTYDINGNTPLDGGFHIAFGGGTLSDLSVGVHFYVCENHYFLGMKGTITVMELGVNDFQLVKNFAVFPNPTTDFIKVKANDNSFGLPYCMTDQSGRQVFAGKLEEVTTTINLGQLTSGIYFLQVGEESRQTFKIIKE